MLTRAQSDLIGKELRPLTLERSGEYTVWGLAIFATAIWIIMTVLGMSVHLLQMILTAFVVLSALAISAGNWADRKMIICAKEEGIHFENGLRKLDLKWDQIEKVQEAPSKMGKKIRVIGNGSYFYFRTFADIQMRGKSKGQMGFAEGETLLQLILNKSNLKPTKQDDAGCYYARE